MQSVKFVQFVALFPVSLETEKAGRVLFGHHVDLGLTEAGFGEDRHCRLKGLSVVHRPGCPRSVLITMLAGPRARISAIF